MPNVYTVLVTYNAMPWLAATMHAYLSHLPASHLLVVDNASDDETTAWLSDNYPEVWVARQSQNLGFGKANNIGIAEALRRSADYVFLLNQDAYLQNNCIEVLVRLAEQNPQYGIISPVHLQADGRGLDTRFAKYIQASKNGPHTLEQIQAATSTLYELPFVNAAGWLLTRQCLHTVGGFNPLFFHYGEDENYCQRVLFHGLKIGYAPKAFLIHDRGQTIPVQGMYQSKAHFERGLKIRCANVLEKNPEAIIKSKRKHVHKMALRSALLLQWANAKHWYGLATHLKTFEKEILAAWKSDQQKGQHYLANV